MAIKSECLSIIAEKIQGFTSFAEAFGKSRFLIYQSEVHAPGEKADAFAKENAEMEAIADSFKCEIKQSGGTFSLYFYMNERNPGHFLEIVDAGMPAPLAGGNHGVSTNPDGSTYPSPTPASHWDDPVPSYAKPATGVVNEIQTMLATLFHDYFQETVESSKKEILDAAKNYTKKHIQTAVGG